MLMLNKKPTEVVLTSLCAVFFIAKCCPILLLVVGSDQDTVRLSLCVCEFFMLAEEEGGREGEVGMRNYNHQ